MMSLADVEDDLDPYPLAGFDEELGNFPIRLPDAVVGVVLDSDAESVRLGNVSKDD